LLNWEFGRVPHSGLFCCIVNGVSPLTLYDKNRQRKYLNQAERQAFYNAVKGYNNPWKRAFFLTLLYTGARISEVLELRARDVDVNDGCLVFETLKQRGDYVPRALPVTPELIADLREIIAHDQLKPADHFWTFRRETGWRNVKKIMKKIGVTGVRATPTGLRHAYAVSLSMRGIALPHIQAAMGHKTSRTTAIYLGVMGDELRQLISETWPT